ncbi:MAG: glycerate kinase [Lachnospiraceae bacterium]|nr:glycerate kinase [Clostridiales bacterium]MCC8080502.1 glycerate kinase [Lachnospiraceae bacterium]
MKAVIAIDSLKGSLSSMEAGEAIRKGILRAKPDAEVVIKPLADGGEGTTDALIEGMSGERVSLCVTGPFGNPVNCHYGYLRREQTAVMEMASAAGITLEPLRDPMKATTRGVGEMILHAIEHGCRNFIIGIGGSATNDGGIGMLKALGYEFLDQNGQDVGEGGQALAKIVSFSEENADPRLKECRFRVACDVTNPLCGPMGATYIYGPQKGVTEDMLEPLDRGMANYARAVTSARPINFPEKGCAGKIWASTSLTECGTNETRVSASLSECGADETHVSASLSESGTDETRVSASLAECGADKTRSFTALPKGSIFSENRELSNLAETPGAGAAGGLGFAFLRFLNAELTPGVDLILNTVGLEKELMDADVLITGEGRLDHQTAMGKAPIGAARLGKKYGVRVIAFAGSVAPGAEACNEAGIDAFFPILRDVCTLEEAMNPHNAKENMVRAVEQVFRLL